MHRLTCASLIATLLTGCHVGAKLKGPSFRLGGDSSAPPPPAPASSSSSASASTPAPPADGGCYQEFGQDAPETRDRAMPIEPGTFQGCTERGGDDWFVINAPPTAAAVLYQFEITAHDDGSNYPCMSVYDGEGASLLQHCEHNGKTAKGWAVVAGGTPVIFDVGSSDGPYTASVTQTLLSDPDEPNDERDSATRLVLGRPHKALFASAGADRDQYRDWYVVDVPKAGTLHVDVVDPGIDVHLEVDVINTDNEHIDSDRSANNGANLRAEVEIPRPGRYYVGFDQWVGVVDAGGRGEPPLRLTKPYTLTATLK